MGISTEFEIEGRKASAPLEGKWLDWAIALDRHSPGFLVFLTCSTGARRHAVFAALARLRRECPEVLAEQLSGGRDGPGGHPYFRLASCLRGMNARSIIEALYGCCPEGLLGFFDRLHPEPLTPSLYGTWHRLYEIGSPHAKVLMQAAGPITEAMWTMALSIDEVALVPAVVARIAKREVPDLNRGIEVIRSACSTVTDADLRASLSNGSGMLDAGRWTLGILKRRMDRLPFGHPICSTDPDFEPIVTGRDHVMNARRFRNCLANDRVGLSATGKVAYATYRHRPAVIEFRRLTAAPGWLAADAYGVRNHRVEADTMREIVLALTDRGVPFLTALGQDDERLTQAMGNADFGPVGVREIAPLDELAADAA